MKIAIKECSACGKDHRDLELTRLPKPTRFKNEEWTHYAICPETNVIVYWTATTEEDTTFIGV